MQKLQHMVRFHKLKILKWFLLRFLTVPSHDDATISSAHSEIGHPSLALPIAVSGGLGTSRPANLPGHGVDTPGMPLEGLLLLVGVAALLQLLQLADGGLLPQLLDLLLRPGAGLVGRRRVVGGRGVGPEQLWRGDRSVEEGLGES